ncbi:MAG: hypothetical protein PWQ12_343 [Clostridiales bacterium]|jgi:hypothetical protein|nr:hypothetical protein [Clostridiales bacterium]
MATVVVSAILALILFFAGKKALEDLRKGKCSGCSGCSRHSKSDICQIKLK